MSATEQKPSILEVTYTVPLRFFIEEVEKALEIKWEDVDDWYVKYGNLFLTMKDGMGLSMSGPSDLSKYCDFKHPETLEVLDEKYEVIP